MMKIVNLQHLWFMTYVARPYFQFAWLAREIAAWRRTKQGVRMLTWEQSPYQGGYSGKCTKAGYLAKNRSECKCSMAPAVGATVSNTFWDPLNSSMKGKDLPKQQYRPTARSIVDNKSNKEMLEMSKS